MSKYAASRQWNLSSKFECYKVRLCINSCAGWLQGVVNEIFASNTVDAMAAEPS